MPDRVYDLNPESKLPLREDLQRSSEAEALLRLISLQVPGLSRAIHPQWRTHPHPHSRLLLRNHLTLPQARQEKPGR